MKVEYNIFLSKIQGIEPNFNFRSNLHNLLTIKMLCKNNLSVGKINNIF